MTLDDTIKRLDELEAKVKPAPWQHTPNAGYESFVLRFGGDERYDIDLGFGESDLGAFLAALRNAYPALRDHIAAQQKHLEKLRDEARRLTAENDRLRKVEAASREKLLRYIEEICYHAPKSCGQCGHPDASCDNDCAEHAAAMAEVAVVKKIIKDMDALAGEGGGR
jgi:uncharacterized coiled-coil protein SlyX